MENKETVIKKVPVEEFILMLDKLYELGVDYVDIVVNLDAAQDSLGLVFTEDYLCGDSPLRSTPDGTTMDLTDLKTDIDLTDSDLNDLT